MMAKGKYDIYLVDDQEIHLPQEVYFSSLNESAKYIIYPGKVATGKWYEQHLAMIGEYNDRAYIMNKIKTVDKIAFSR